MRIQSQSKWNKRACVCVCYERVNKSKEFFIVEGSVVVKWCVKKRVVGGIPVVGFDPTSSGV